MKYLLDTHIYLWWLNDDRKLSKQAKNIISNPENIILVSVMSFWEISIKVRAKKLPLKTSFDKLVENLQFDLLPINLEHVASLHKLPLHHKDPFDRMLIAQTKTEDCILITDDSQINQYKVSTSY